jgi:hypothetical protein
MPGTRDADKTGMESTPGEGCARVEPMCGKVATCMPWNHQYSPLDKTIGQLVWLSNQMRADLAMNAEISRDDYHSVLIVIERMTAELRPLQDLRVQEQS